MFFSIFFRSLCILFISLMVFGMFLYPFITVRLKKTALKKNTKKPKVTVIIPVYNEEKLISSKLENILS